MNISERWSTASSDSDLSSIFYTGILVKLLLRVSHQVFLFKKFSSVGVFLLFLLSNNLILCLDFFCHVITVGDSQYRGYRAKDIYDLLLQQIAFLSGKRTSASPVSLYNSNVRYALVHCPNKYKKDFKRKLTSGRKLYIP